MTNRWAMWLLFLAGLVASSGATCPRMTEPYAEAPTPVFGPAPSMAEVARAVNDNSVKVRSLAASDAKISIPGHPFLPTVKATLAWERERHFRLIGETTLAGPEFDLGSNDDLFWIWLRQSAQPMILYCRHEQFPSTEAARVFPVDPQWLIDACGMPVLDPRREHQGPYPVQPREGMPPQYVVYSRYDTPQGPISKSTVIDATYGFVLQQSLVDATGRAFAVAVTEDHRREPLTGAYVPRKITLEWPVQQFGLQIELNDLRTNDLAAQEKELWSMPQYAGAAPVDLADPRLRIAELFPPLPPPQPAAESSTPAKHRTPFGLFDWLLGDD